MRHRNEICGREMCTLHVASKRMQFYYNSTDVEVQPPSPAKEPSLFVLHSTKAILYIHDVCVWVQPAPLELRIRILSICPLHPLRARRELLFQIDFIQFVTVVNAATQFTMRARSCLLIFFAFCECFLDFCRVTCVSAHTHSHTKPSSLADSPHYLFSISFYLFICLFCMRFMYK